MDHGPPGSSVHGILQARIQEWVAISFSLKKSGCMYMYKLINFTVQQKVYLQYLQYCKSTIVQ